MKPLFRVVNKLKEEFPYEKDDEGNIILSMTVQDDSGLLSPYSIGDHPVIANDVADFLDSCTDGLVVQNKLHLRIYSDCINEEEKLLYEKAVRSYYSNRYAATARELHRNTLFASVFAFIGIAVLALLVIFASYLRDGIWTEVIDIVAWVFLWEATDLYFLENRALKLERKRLHALAFARIDFIRN